MSERLEYGYEFTWAPGPSARTTLRGRGFSSIEDRDEAFRNALADYGYERPRWWQWWRWGEGRPAA